MTKGKDRYQGSTSLRLKTGMLSSYLVIFFSGVVGSVVDLLVAVPLLSVVDVAWSGVGSVFAPGTPVVPPWVACSGVGFVFTPGTPVALPCAPVVGFSSANAKVLDNAKAVTSAIVVNLMFISSRVDEENKSR
jgi:hypothetical protein